MEEYVYQSLENKHNIFTWHLFWDFIDLTQVHNFTVNAQHNSTFGQLLLFTLSLTGIKQVLMQIMKRFVSPNWLVQWLWYRVNN